MLPHKPFVPQTFENGVCMIGKMTNAAPKGKRPAWDFETRYTLNFSERVVGVYRHREGLQNDIRIDRLIRVYRHDDVTTNDTVDIRGERYFIRQVQYIMNVQPPVMDLSLERWRQDDT